MKKLLPRQFFIKTIISVLLSSPAILLSQITSYTADGNTILLDHFDGSTSATISAYSYTGATCVTMPAATPNYFFSQGPNGLSQALTLNAPDLEPAGSGTYLNYPGGQLLSQGNGTIEFWLYVTNYGAGLSLVEQGTYYDACSGWTFGMSIDAAGVLSASAWSAFSMNSGSTLVPLNTWTHVAATWGLGGSKLYINGIEAGSDANTGYPAPGYGGSVMVRVGNNSGSSGIIDELRISDIARTPAEFNLMQSIPKITSFTPTSGAVGSTVTISGTNFNILTTNNIVRFGAVQAWVSSATSTELQVIVPTGATYQPITITDVTTGLTASSNAPFTVTFPSSQIINSSSFASAVDFTGGTGPYNIAIGDLDGDAKPDLAVINTSSNTVSVFRNTSTSGSIDAGSFATQVDFITGSDPDGIAIGDLDGDGKSDLVVSNYTSNTVSVFRNTCTSGSITTGSFADKVDFITAAGPIGVAIGDINGDGRPELVVANGSSNSVSVLRNTCSIGTIASSSFSDKADFTTGLNPWCVVLSDIDGDGKSDMVVTNYLGNSISVLRNTSINGSIMTGSFADKVDFTVGTYPYSVVAGDIDGDSKPDLAVTNFSSNTVSVFRNISSSGTIDASSLATPVDFITGSNPYVVALGDIDGDSKPDMAVANYSSNTVSVFRNTSTSGSIAVGSFAEKVDFSTGSLPCYIAIGDLDGDMKPDLAVANYSSNTISVLRNTISETTLLPVISSFTPTSGPVGSTVTISGTNFNILTTNNIVWFGAVQATVTATSATELTVTVPTGATYQPITVTDVTTGLTAYSSLPFTVTFPSTQVIDATAFASTVDFAAGTGTFFVALGDIDGDGKPDLTASNAGSNTFSVFRNISTSGSITSGSFAGNIDFSTGGLPYTAALGDIDGDGKLDLAIANFSSNTVSVFRNTSTSGSIDAGSFTAMTDFITGTGPRDIAIGDVDGDGKPDLAVNNYNSNTVSILRNTSTSGSINSGSFADKVDFATGNGPHYLTTGDIDGDGKPDLVITNYLDNTISVLRNISTSGSITTGSFEVKVDFSTVTQPHCVTISDIDVDGKPDILVADQGSNTVSVFRNISTPGSVTAGSLAANVDFITGSSPVYIAVGDIDGDDKPDIAVANQGSNTVSVFRNTSTSGTIDAGSFAAKTDFNTGTGPSFLTIGDIDGDGKPDIAVSNYTGNTVSVLRNTISNSSLVAYYPFNNNALDESGYGNNATVFGALNSTDRYNTDNKAYIFNGTDNYISSPQSASLNFTGEITVCAWINPSRVDISQQSICSKGGGWSRAGWLLTLNNNKVRWHLGDGATEGMFDSDISIPADKWSYVVALWQGGTMNIYINGVKDINSSAWASGLVANTYDLYIGKTDMTTFFFNGKIDDISVYNRALSESEIGALYHEGGWPVPTVISSFTPTSGPVGSSVTITGNNFNTTTTNNIVRFGAVQATVITATATELTATVPTGASYQPITVTDVTTGLTAYSGSPFSVTFPSTQVIDATAFAPTVDFNTGTNPFCVAIGDIDGDSKPDLVVANSGDNKISIYRNTSNSGSIGAGSFTAGIDFIAGTNPFDIALGDIDGDGKSDLAIINRGSNSVSIFRNTSTSGSIDAGSFAAPIDFTTGPGPNGIAIRDFDGDGKPDLAVSNWSSNTVSVFRNTSSSGSITAGSFAAAVDFVTGSSPSGVAAGDIDGDGKPDLVVTNNNNSTVSVLKNISISGSIEAGSFAARVDFTTETNPLNVAFGDIDGDGKPDLIIAYNVGSSLSVLRNTSAPGSIDAGSFAALVDFITGTNPYQIAIGDIDGDGKPDLAVNNSGSNTVSVLRNTSTFGSITAGSFADKVDLAAGSNPYSIAIDDIDGDGKPDLVFTNNGSSSVSVLHNTILTAFPPAITTFTPTSGPIGTSVTITGTNFNTTASNNIVWFGAVQATVTAATTTELTITVPTGATYQPITVTDVTTGLTASSVQSFDVTFASSNVIDAYVFATAEFSAGAGSSSYSVKLSDIDGDGKSDLVVANSGSNTVSVYRNVSISGSVDAASFSTKVDFATSIYPYTVAVGDIDGDGKPDLAVANWSGNTVSVIRNTSASGSIDAGSFAGKVDFSTGAQPYGVAIGDLDDDGKPELVVTNYTDATISVFKNNCTSGSITIGSFSGKVDFLTGTTPWGVAIADIDGDGKPDLNVANYSGNTISLFRNTSSRGNITPDSFAGRVDFATNANPYSIASGDIDGDGKTDLAVTNFGANTVSVYRNTSTSGNIDGSSLAGQVEFSTGVQPGGISLGDLDGDGKPDMAVSNYSGNTVSVYKNTSTAGSITTGSFSSRVDYIAGTQPSGIVIGDIDGDSKPDLAAVNVTSNTVSVHRNRILNSSLVAWYPLDNNIIDNSGNGNNGTDQSFLPAAIDRFGVDAKAVTFDGIDDYIVAGDPIPEMLKIQNEITLSAWIKISQMPTELAMIAGSQYDPTYSGASIMVDGRVNSDGQTCPAGHIHFQLGNGSWHSSNTNSVLPTNQWIMVTAVRKANEDAKIYYNNQLQPSASVSWDGTLTYNSSWFGIGNQKELSRPFNGSMDDIRIYNKALSESEIDALYHQGGWPFIPTILSFAPTSGPVGTVITITGTNFNTTPANNKVWFGAVQAVVNSATTTELTVTVPTGATYQPITVTDVTTGLTAYSTAPFNVMFTSTQLINNESFSPSTDFAEVSYPEDVAIGDIDGDGKPDLAVVNFSGNTVSLYRNISSTGSISTGSFDTRVDISTGNGPRGVVIGDFDGDGKPDMAVTNFGENTMSLYRNISTTGSIDAGSFAGRIDFATGGNPYYITTGDIDSDGKPDLAVSNWATNTVTIYRNTCTSGSISTGSFAIGVDFPTGSNPFGIVIGDIDGDSKPDLLVSNWGNSTVSVFRNTSVSGLIDPSSFAGRVDFGSGANPYEISIADIDMDGKPDLIVANNGGSTVSVFRNTSTTGTVDAGTFAGMVDFAAGSGPFGVSIGDINGDGKPDMAVTNTTSNNVSVYRNTSISGTIDAGSFAGKVDFSSGGYPQGIVLGDIDGDNKPDLTYANSSANTLSVLRNIIVTTWQPVIASFTPASGPVGTSVTISGTNFNTTAANNVVWFGAVQATVTAATATDLTVTVPTGATYQPVTVTDITTGLTAYSDAPFTVTFPSSQVIDATAYTLAADITTGSYPEDIATGDIDGDGKPDLVQVNYSSNTVSVFRNTSTSGSISAGSFTEKVDLGTGNNPRGVVIGDLDGDGKPDLAVTNFSDNTISVFRNTSTPGSITTGSFAGKIDFTTGVSPYIITIGDVDMDGKPDLAVSNWSGSTVSVFRNISASGSITTGSFADKVDFSTGSAPFGIVFGDIDGDKKPDLAVTNYNSSTVSVLRNTSSYGSITAASFAGKVDFSTGAGPYGISIGDIDMDGKPDLAIANFGEYTVSLFRNTGTSGTIDASTLSGKTDFATGNGPFDVNLGDLDGDGKPDLAVTNTGSNTVSVFRNTSTPGSITSASLTSNVDFLTGNYPLGVAISDIDGDNKPDLVVTNSGAGTVSVLRNNMPGNLPPSVSSFAPVSGPVGTNVTVTGTNFNTTAANNIVWFGAVQATVTAATATEISVTVPTGATYQPITVTDVTTGLTAYSKEPFTVTFPSSQLIDATSFASTVDFNTGIYPTGVAVGDIDGDSKPDLAIVNFNSNTVSIYRNTSSSGSVDIGSFATPVDFSIGSGPFSIALGDIDGDGKPDLAVANSGSNTVSVFRNTSSAGSITTGSFSDKTDFTTGTNPYYLSIGDINGDGKPDLAVTNYSDNTVSVFENTGTKGSINAGSFAGKVDFATGTNPEEVVLGDIDGDGKPDLAITNSTSNTVSVLRNTSTIISISAGSFADKVDFTTGTAPRNLALGDVDGDGKPDIAVTNSGGNTVSVFRNISSSGSITTGSFENSVDFSTITGARGIAFGDIDGDGKPDLAVANAGSNTISVFRNTSTPGSITTSSFTSNIDFNAGTNPYQVVVGDIDGDGKPDLTVVNFNSNSVSVLRNTIPIVNLPPAISSFAPVSGPVGTNVTVTGTNFNTTAANNIVWFGAVQATVTAATSTEITVTVPTGATYQPITVTDVTTGLTAYSVMPFTVTFPGSHTINSSAFAAPVGFTTGTNPYNVAIGDIDGDGKTDLAVTNLNSNTVSVYRNTSTTGDISAGSFADKVDYATGSGPFGIAIGDIDGDGKPDMVVTNRNDYTISVFRNTGVTGVITTGSFEAKVDFATGAFPYSVAIADITGDGRPELSVTNAYDNTISILWNSGSSGSVTTGSFSTRVDFGTETTPYGIPVEDVDGDSKPDVIVTNSTYNALSVFRNTGIIGPVTTSSLAGRVDFATGIQPNNVVIADIDGNGKPDLVVTNGNSNTVSVLSNTSTSGVIDAGSFAGRVDFSTGANPFGIAAGDIDGDGKPDLAIANSGATTVSVLKNTSTSGVIDATSFANTIDFEAGSNPYYLAICDIDGDGRPDIVTPDVNSNIVSVLWNTLVAPLLPTIDSFTPSSGIIGSSVTINGTNFGATQGTSVVVFGTTSAAVTSWSPTQIIVTVPSLTDGNYTISVTTSDGTANSSTQFIVSSLPPPAIDSFTPSSGIVGSSVTINGSNFGDLQGTSVVVFGTTAAAVTSWSSTQIIVTVPSLTDGNYTISITTSDGTANSSTQFIVSSLPPPIIDSFNPSSGQIGSSVTIYGSNFGDTQGTSVVEFGTSTASINSWTSTQIVALVPALADGDYTISVTTPDGTVTSSTIFTVFTPAPTITSFTPGSGMVGSTVTISGTDFGVTQGTSVVEFGTTTASINDWSSTQIVAVVPALVDGEYTISVITSGGTAYSSTIFTVFTPLCDKPVIRKKGSINILMCLTPSAKSYQWYLDDQPVTGATKQFYVARANYGSYYVEVVYSDNCINRSDAISVSTYSAVKIYPNPSNSRISVDLNFDQTGEARIKILNSSGVLKRIITVNKILDAQSLTIDIDDLEKGIYFVGIEVNGEIIAMEKVIIL